MWESLVVVCFFVSCARSAYPNLSVNQIGTQKLSGPVAPQWDIETQSLYYVNNVNNGSGPFIFRYSYDEDTIYSAYLAGQSNLSFILPVANGRDLFVVGKQNKGQLIRWDGRSDQVTPLQDTYTLDANSPLAATAYGRTDPNGRFFGGTISIAYCYNTTDFSPYSVYRYDRQNGLTRVISSTFTVGIAFNPKTRKMYHLSLCRALITEYDWDPETGDICNGRVAFDFDAAGIDTSGANAPDTLAIDTNGLLYSTLTLSGIIVIDPWRGAVVNTIALPVQGASGVVFGGKNLDTLFVVVSASFINYDTAEIYPVASNGSSLYSITGTGARTFVESATRLQIQQLS